MRFSPASFFIINQFTPLLRVSLANLTDTRRRFALLYWVQQDYVMQETCNPTARS